MEGVSFANGFLLPVRLFMSVFYNSRRIFTIVDWAPPRRGPPTTSPMSPTCKMKHALMCARSCHRHQLPPQMGDGGGGRRLLRQRSRARFSMAMKKAKEGPSGAMYVVVGVLEMSSNQRPAKKMVATAEP
ncbi:mto 1responding down 1 [Striga asiatica]|uniref:Mto 1responding down 1 n=1 Tax=Striga asiatica TaxID=4170 RepID=A0A5A7RAN6_STRAF|nr:mto 1responding down 1 [Striga asiatica]